MIPVHLIGIAIAGELALARSGILKKDRKASKVSRVSKVRKVINRRSTSVRRNINISNKPNPISQIITSLNTSLNGITEKVTSSLKKEDLREIIQAYLPADAKLIKPKYPIGISEIQSVDLDGDREKELIASYQKENEITTFVLKKKNDLWTKIHEMKNLDYLALNYIDFADLRGSGKKDLLVGWNKGEKQNTLDIFKLDNYEGEKIATYYYNRFEILDVISVNKVPKKIAVWNRNDEGAFDISLLMWKDEDFVELADMRSYYAQSVAPYYANLVKQKPMVSTNWYYLSDALVKAGLYNDALISIQTANQMNPDTHLKSKFLELQEYVKGKLI